MADYREHSRQVNAQTWARLPEAVRQQVMARHQNRNEDDEAVASGLLRHQLKYALIGATLALLCSVGVGDMYWWYRGAYFLAGGVASYLFTRDRRGRPIWFFGLAGIAMAITHGGGAIGVVLVWPILSALACTFLGIFGALMSIVSGMEHHQKF